RPWRVPRARRAARSPARASPLLRRAVPARRARPRSAPAAPRPASTTRQYSIGLFLPHELAQDPVHQPRSILGCIPLRERHRLGEDDLDRHLPLVELLEGDAEDVALDSAEAVCRPVVGGGRDPRVEHAGMLGHRIGELPRVAVDLAFVERAQRPSRDVPLEEHQEDGAPDLAPDGHGIARTGPYTLNAT